MEESLSKTIFKGIIISSLISVPILGAGYYYVNFVDIENRREIKENKEKVVNLEEEVKKLQDSKAEIIKLEKKLESHEIRLSQAEKITGKMFNYLAKLDANGDKKLEELVIYDSGNAVVYYLDNKGGKSYLNFNSYQMKLLTDDYFFGTENFVTKNVVEEVLIKNPEAFCSMEKIAKDLRFWTTDTNTLYSNARNRIKTVYSFSFECV